jgi:hypothetical protein
MRPAFVAICWKITIEKLLILMGISKNKTECIVKSSNAKIEAVILPIAQFFSVFEPFLSF